MIGSYLSSVQDKVKNINTRGTIELRIHALKLIKDVGMNILLHEKDREVICGAIDATIIELKKERESQDES